MSIWRHVRIGLRALVKRPAADREIADEVEHYLGEAIEGYVACGLTREEARRAARLDLGSADSLREEVRGYGWENAVESFLADLRHAVRRLWSAPGFSAAAVITLAIGIGGTTAIFSAVHPILFEPLPYPQPDRIRMIVETHSDGSRSEGTFGMYRELADRVGSFEAMAVLRPWRPTITGTGLPERLDGQRVSASYFRVLGVAPALGRDFLESDDRPGGPDVVVLSEGFWQRRFGGDPGIVGSRIELDERSYEVVGVMPGGFENVLAPSTEAWAPLQYGIMEGRAWGHHLRTVGRLREGVAAAEATDELNAVALAVIRDQRPPTYSDDMRWFAPSLGADVAEGARPALLAVMGAMLLVLLIACVNVTNLLLARGVERRGEFALRASLGARRGRLVRQLLTESLLLAAVGGVAGIAVAAAGVRALVALAPAGMPRVDAIGFSATVLQFGVGVTLLVGLAFGLIPAIQAARGRQADLRHASHRTTGRHHRVRGALVIAQVALALVLLVGSGLLLRSLQQLFAVSPGFDPSLVLTMQVQISGERYREDGATHRFFEQALGDVRQIPGVTEAALTSQLPLSGDLDRYGVHLESSPVPPSEDERGAFRYAVSPGYLETMRIPLLSGRSLTEQDRAGAPLVALINESMASRRFPGMDPIGQRLRIGPLDGEPYMIVGVVGDVAQESLALGPADAVYTTPGQWRFADDAMSFVIRGQTETAALAPTIQEAIWSVDGDRPVLRVAMLDDLLAASAAERRFALILFQSFALAALLLAAAGLYGVVSGSVAERIREIGVRSALGATPGSIVRLVIRQGLGFTLLGVTIGLPAAAGLSRLIEALLFGTSRLDPVTYVAMIALLVAVSVIACGIPARRAAGVDPATTLRAD